MKLLRTSIICCVLILQCVASWAVYGVRISDLSNSPAPANPIKVWGSVSSVSPVKISDGTSEIQVNGLSAALGDFVVVTGDWDGTVLTVSITNLVVGQASLPSIGGWACTNLCRSPRPTSEAYTAGTATHLSCCSASFWYLPKAVRNLRVVILVDTCNFNLANNLTLKASVRHSGLITPTPVTFRGVRSFTAAPHTLLVSDPIPGLLNPQEVEVRLLTTVANGETIPATDSFSPGYGFTTDKNSWNDQVDSETFAAANWVTMPFSAFKPMTLIGEFENGRQPIICAIGDSITYGLSGSSTASSMMSHIFGQATGNPIAVINVAGMYSSTPALVMEKCPALLQLFEGYPIVISSMGRNAVTSWNDNTPTTNPFKVQMLKWWSTLKALGASEIYQTTITPYTKWIADNGDTPDNQEPFGSNYDSYLKLENTWIKTLPGGDLSGYIDWADAVTEENSAGVSVWKTGTGSSSNLNAGTGILHPTAYGNSKMSDAVAARLPYIHLPEQSSKWTDQFTTRPSGASLILRNNEPLSASTIIDYSGNNRAIANIGSTVETGMDGRNVRHFDGNNDGMVISAASSSQAITLLMWCNFDSTPSASKYLLQFVGSSILVGSVGSSHRPGFISPSIYDDSLTTQAGWHLYGWQINNTGATSGELADQMVRYWKDATSHIKTGQSWNGSTLAYTGLEVGKLSWDTNGAGTVYGGTTGEILIYPSILSAAEITAIYEASKIRYGIL